MLHLSKLTTITVELLYGLRDSHHSQVFNIIQILVRHSSCYVIYYASSSDGNTRITTHHARLTMSYPVSFIIGLHLPLHHDLK